MKKFSASPFPDPSPGTGAAAGPGASGPGAVVGPAAMNWKGEELQFSFLSDQNDDFTKNTSAFVTVFPSKSWLIYTQLF